MALKKKLIFNDDVLSFDNDCVSNGFSLALTITWVNWSFFETTWQLKWKSRCIDCTTINNMPATLRRVFLANDLSHSRCVHFWRSCNKWHGINYLTSARGITWVSTHDLTFHCTHTPLKWARVYIETNKATRGIYKRSHTSVPVRKE